MRSRSQTALTPSATILIVTVSALICALLFPLSIHAQEKKNADAEFLTKIVPSIAASIKIIDYEVTNGSDEKVKEFAGRVLKQHKESVGIASGHAKRLNIAVVADPDKDSKEMIDKLSQLNGTDRDAAFLEWLGHIHHDTTLFDNEVKNGTDPELVTYAKNSISAGNEHLHEAHELLAKLKN
jgi:putative membrane protein